MDLKVPRSAAAWQGSTSPDRQYQGDRWTSIPNALHALVDTPREFQLVSALLSYRWRPSSPIIPSVDTLARQINCSRRTIRRTVAALEARGLLRREERRAEDARQMSNRYVLCGALLAFVTRIEAGRVQEERQPWQGRGSPVAGERNPRNETRRTRGNQPGYGRPGGRIPLDPTAYTTGALGDYVRH